MDSLSEDDSTDDDVDDAWDDDFYPDSETESEDECVLVANEVAPVNGVTDILNADGVWVNIPN